MLFRDSSKIYNNKNNARRPYTSTAPQVYVTHTQQGNEVRRFWAKADLEKKGFTGLAHDYYLVYEFNTGKSADYPNLTSLARGRQTTSPGFATWEVLMEKKE